jgi:predicted lipid-binding transport protein (Tim44 family)
MSLDIYTIVFFVIAVAIFVRLYGVLGKKTGSERPPFLPSERPERTDRSDDSTAGNDNVVVLPSRGEPVVRPEGAADPDPIDASVPPGSALSTALRTIVAADRGFDPTQFVTGAKAAYEMVVTAYASGDRRTLRNLLSKEVMDGFARGLDERDSRGEKVEFTFVGLDKADIVEAGLADRVARITVRFVAKVISVTHAADGSVIEGDPSRLTDLVDVWTFAREVGSPDPNWRLVETRAAD